MMIHKAKDKMSKRIDELEKAGCTHTVEYSFLSEIFNLLKMETKCPIKLSLNDLITLRRFLNRAIRCGRNQCDKRICQFINVYPAQLILKKIEQALKEKNGEEIQQDGI